MQLIKLSLLSSLILALLVQNANAGSKAMGTAAKTTGNAAENVGTTAKQAAGNVPIRNPKVVNAIDNVDNHIFFNLNNKGREELGKLIAKFKQDESKLKNRFDDLNIELKN